MHKHCSAILILVVAPVSASVAATNIIREAGVLELAIPQPLTEPRAATNPVDADHVLIAAIVAPRNPDDPWDCAIFASFDRGDSWSTGQIGIDHCIDPWLEFMDGDIVVFAAIRIASSGQGEDRLRLVLSTSVDGGRTWSVPVEAGRNFEHPIIVADGKRALVLTRRGETSPGGQPRHFIEVGAYEPLSREYRQFAIVRPSNARLTNTGFVPGKDGAFYGSFYDFGRNVDGFSDDGLLSTARAWGIRLRDDGTPSVPLLITDRCGGQKTRRPLFPGYPFLARGDGHFYHACIAPNHEGVLFAASLDGESWTASRRIDAADGPGFALTAMLAANDSGGVVVAWQDRGNDPDCQRLLLVTSANNGKRFSEPLSLSRAPSCPASDENGRAGSSWPGGGDYSSIAVDRDGYFHVVWAQTVAGRYRLAYAIVEVSK